MSQFTYEGNRLLPVDFESSRRIAHYMVDHAEAFREPMIIVPIEQLALDAVLSPERVRLLQEVRAHGPFERLDDLAAALGRSKARTSQDVAMLERHGMLICKRAGRTKRIAADPRPILLV